MKYNFLQFDEIEFSEIVRTNITLARYTHPTPVQVTILMIKLLTNSQLILIILFVTR